MEKFCSKAQLHCKLMRMHLFTDMWVNTHRFLQNIGIITPQAPDTYHPQWMSWLVLEYAPSLDVGISNLLAQVVATAHGSCVMCHVSCLLCTLTTHKWKAADCSMTDLFLQQLKEALICFWCLNQPYDWLQQILNRNSDKIFSTDFWIQQQTIHIILGWSAEYWPYQLKRLCSFPYFFLSNPIFW